MNNGATNNAHNRFQDLTTLLPPPAREAAGYLNALSMEEIGKKVVQPKVCSRGHWRPKEDAKLKDLVAQFGPQNWNIIAEKLEGRSGRNEHALIYFRMTISHLLLMMFLFVDL